MHKAIVTTCCLGPWRPVCRGVMTNCTLLARGSGSRGCQLFTVSCANLVGRGRYFPQSLLFSACDNTHTLILLFIVYFKFFPSRTFKPFTPLHLQSVKLFFAWVNFNLIRNFLLKIFSLSILPPLHHTSFIFLSNLFFPFLFFHTFSFFSCNVSAKSHKWPLLFREWQPVYPPTYGLRHHRIRSSFSHHPEFPRLERESYRGNNFLALPW